jgi:hypothetical protein
MSCDSRDKLTKFFQRIPGLLGMTFYTSFRVAFLGNVGHLSNLG